MTTSPITDQELPPEVAFDESDYAAFLDLVRSIMREESTERWMELRNTFRCRAYVDGNQHLVWDKTAHIYFSAANEPGMPRYMSAFNITKPHFRSFVSILSQNPPGINFVPNDLGEPQDVSAASAAEKMRKRIDRFVSMKDLQTEVSGLFCTDRRTCAWVRTNEQGQLKITVHGTPETKVPMYIRNQKDWGYAVVSEDMDLWQEKEEWPQYADKIESNDSGVGGDYERYARLGVLGESRGINASAWTNLCTRHTAWIRPSRYRKLADETKDKARSLCPNGVRVTISGGVVVDVIPQAMEEALRFEWPGPGQKNSRPSLLHDILPIQDAYNEYKNHLREQADYVDSTTFLDGNSFDEEAIAEIESTPGGIVSTKQGGNKAMSDIVFNVPGVQLDAGLISQCDQLTKDAEDISGDLPILQGLGAENQDTVGVNKLLSAQAKGQLTMPWAAIQRLFAGICMLAIPIIAQMEAEKGTISIQGNDGQESLNPAAVLNGNFGCYADQDSSFPETMADKRAAFQNLMTQLASGPDGAKIALMPDNLKSAVQLSGMNDLVVIPAVEARDKALQTIGKLLQEPTQPPTPEVMQQWQQAALQAQQQGQPVPPQPQNTSSRQPDPDWDYAEEELEKYKEWLSSPTRMEYERQGKLDEIMNVRLYGMALKQIVQSQQVPPQIPPPKVSISLTTQDPTAVANGLNAAGLTQPTAQSVEASQVPALQEAAAKTAHAASQARHVDVLAAKEAVAAPKIHNVVPIQPAPDVAAEE